ncbi:IS3 family transposase [Mesoplasma florum]|uniref:IS3 family transposase n=1 Tax=Mesoplasma florum TaxID=2151 RepID=UPI000BE2B8B6|nr:IS3 family transposase [Mesoplasma florum]ATI73649.1 transposase [Mesoplasma florum]ATI74095.1 transposase [Mesoplasma florum]ATI74224.1 transposase [Mesoplasma florum]ATI74327.1 transposase [Mesoplasma florum]
MSKNLKIEEWIEVIKIFNLYGSEKAIEKYCKFSNLKLNSYRSKINLRTRIRDKSILVDNYGMKTLKRKQGSGRPNKKPLRDDSDIPSIIDKLNDEQLKEIAELWIKEQRDKKQEGNKSKMTEVKSLTISLKASILKIHRTTFYKKPKTKNYKYDFAKKIVENIFNENKRIYGSERISQILLIKFNIHINPRTLRHYMNRWNLKTHTRVRKKKREEKNTNVKFKDLVKRNYNPLENNIIATDVSYIPAKSKNNNVYLSVAISHKTKKIEAWSISEINDTNLVVDTLKQINKTNYICHSDHGSQYSTYEVQNLLNKTNSKTSMSRIGNSLDNREVEYFFGCLKGEYLNKIKTFTMKLNEIKKHVSWYINWYNNERIQGVLKWKTPAEADVNN